MSKIAPCLWFDGDAEEAATFYTSILPDSRIDRVNPAAADTPSGPEGSVLSVDFTLAGQQFIGLNGGPDFQFNEAISFSIDCEDQAEVDRLWEKLVEGGGEHSVCGWLKDRYGVSWQVIPRRLPELVNGPDPQGAARAMQAMLQMTKIDVAKIEEAYEGVPVEA
jgi:predicted 3-demethylubiquinone-9 3-methyltransferase (glyoxalase superfamily)